MCVFMWDVDPCLTLSLVPGSFPGRTPSQLQRSHRRLPRARLFAGSQGGGGTE